MASTVSNGNDRSEKWHRPFQMATTVLPKWHRPFQMATTVYEREICCAALLHNILVDICRAAPQLFERPEEASNLSTRI